MNKTSTGERSTSRQSPALPRPCRRGIALAVQRIKSVVALLLALNRKIHRAYNRVREGNFALEGLLGFDLKGRTVGVVAVQSYAADIPFTEREGGSQHSSVDNSAYAMDYIADWVAETLGEKRSETELSPALATEFENLQLIDLFS